MAPTPVVALVVACVAAIMVERTSAVCCKVMTFSNRCADCTHGTPYCGYGGCNIFGCACNGGCRTTPSNCESYYYQWTYYCECDKKRSTENRPQLTNSIAARDVFSSIDTDRDGGISEEEFAVSLEAMPDRKRSVDVTFVQAEFSKMDVNNDRRIDSGEFDPDLQ